MATREQFIDEARSWILTPYHMRAMIKGVGADCATFIVGALRNCQMIPEETMQRYSSDWWAHTKDEAYMRQMLRFCLKIAESVSSASVRPDPGNIILCRTAGSHVYNHGAIVTEWPMGIHAVKPHVMEVDLIQNPMWSMKDVAIFDPFQKEQ